MLSQLRVAWEMLRGPPKTPEESVARRSNLHLITDIHALIQRKEKVGFFGKDDHPMLQLLLIEAGNRVDRGRLPLSELARGLDEHILGELICYAAWLSITPFQPPGTDTGRKAAISLYLLNLGVLRGDSDALKAYEVWQRDRLAIKGASQSQV